MNNTHPKVAPDAPIYWPSVLIMPLGPAPYRKILTVPEARVRVLIRTVGRVLSCRTIYEADDDADGY